MRIWHIYIYLKGQIGYASLAESRDDVDTEERHPTDEKHTHDDTNGDGRFVIGHVIRAGRFTLGLWFGTLGAFALRAKALGQRRRFGQLRHRTDALHVFLSVAVQSAVDADHHDARHVERDARRYYRVGRRQV